MCPARWSWSPQSPENWDRTYPARNRRCADRYRSRLIARSRSCHPAEAYRSDRLYAPLGEISGRKPFDLPALSQPGRCRYLMVNGADRTDFPLRMASERVPLRQMPAGSNAAAAEPPRSRRRLSIYSIHHPILAERSLMCISTNRCPLLHAIARRDPLIPTVKKKINKY